MSADRARDMWSGFLMRYTVRVPAAVDAAAAAAAAAAAKAAAAAETAAEAAAAPGPWSLVPDSCIMPWQQQPL